MKEYLRRSGDSSLGRRMQVLHAVHAAQSTAGLQLWCGMCTDGVIPCSRGRRGLAGVGVGGRPGRSKTTIHQVQVAKRQVGLARTALARRASASRRHAIIMMADSTSGRQNSSRDASQRGLMNIIQAAQEFNHKRRYSMLTLRCNFLAAQKETAALELDYVAYANRGIATEQLVGASSPHLSSPASPHLSSPLPTSPPPGIPHNFVTPPHLCSPPAGCSLARACLPAFVRSCCPVDAGRRASCQRCYVG